MKRLKDFIQAWFDKPACRRLGGWTSTPDRIGYSGGLRSRLYSPRRPETEILAIRLGTGEVISNASVLRVARGEPMAFGRPRSSPEAPAQRLCIDLGALPVPFGALAEAGVPMPADFEAHIPDDLSVLDWKGPETVAIEHRHRTDERCSLCGRWPSTPSSHQEERHYTGAALVVESGKQFLFDLDRGELCHGRWNPFVCLLAEDAGAKSVEEAYASLMPEPVREAKAAGLEVKRQGEWFFIPDAEFTPPEADEALLASVRPRPYALGYGLHPEDVHEFDGSVRSGVERTEGIVLYEADLAAWNRTDEALRRLLPSERTLQVKGSRGHDVSRAVELPDGRVYATGTVTAPDHDDLVLEGWHLTLPNTAARSFRITGAID